MSRAEESKESEKSEWPSSIKVTSFHIKVPRPKHTCSVCKKEVFPCEHYMEVWNNLLYRKESIHFQPCSYILWKRGHLDDGMQIAYPLLRRCAPEQL